MKTIATIAYFVMVNVIFAQYCDSLTPSFNVNLSASADAFWISPNIARDGNCCSTSNPDKCIEFEILLNEESQGIIFDFYSGAIPPGALFYQIDCGPVVEVGEPICLDGPGPHHLTFCKPGNNSNEYLIQSIPKPTFSPDIVINDGCFGQLGVAGINEATVTWTSVFPGNPGDYDSYLSCTAGCDTVDVTAQAGYPPYVEFMVCGMPLNECDTLLSCHTMVVTFHSTLQVVINPLNPTICYGSSDIELTAMPQGGTPPYQLTWNTLETTTSIMAGAGTFIVTLQDSSGCPPTFDTIQVIQYTAPIIANAGNDINICVMDLPASLNGLISGASGGVWTGGGGTYSTSNTDLNSTYTPSNTEKQNGYTQLYLTSTGNHNCPSVTDTVVVHYRNISENIALSKVDATCYGYSNGSAGINLPTQDGPYSILWNTGGTTSNINNLASGNYQVSVSNIYGCDTTLSIAILQPTPVTLQQTTENVSCSNGFDGAVSIKAMGGTAPYILNWSGLNFAFIADSILVHMLSAGNYNFSVRDMQNCTENSNAIITEPTPLTITVTGEDTVCYNTPQNLHAAVTGGTSPYTFLWSNGGLDSPYNSFISTESENTYVTALDNNGCGISSFFYTFVQKLYQDSLELATSGDVCEGEEVVISASYSGIGSTPNYQWGSCSCDGIGSFIQTPDQTTTYTFTVSDFCNNQITDSVIVIVHPLPVIELPSELAIGCPPLQVDFPVDSSLFADQLFWDYGDGSSISTNSTHTYLFSGDYNVTLIAEDQYGCKATSTGQHNVHVHEKPNAGIWTDKVLVDTYFPYINFKSNSSGETTYYWDFDDGSTSYSENEKHQFEQPGSYNVLHIVENSYGCQDSTYVEIIINPAIGIFVPNAFTPDGDGVNDEFFIKGTGLINEDFEMNIYDRWGELIFTSNQLDGKWSGEVKGMPNKAKTEVYVYVISVKDQLYETHELTGHVALLK